MHNSQFISQVPVEQILILFLGSIGPSTWLSDFLFSQPTLLARVELSCFVLSINSPPPVPKNEILDCTKPSGIIPRRNLFLLMSQVLTLRCPPVVLEAPPTMLLVDSTMLLVDLQLTRLSGSARRIKTEHLLFWS